MATVEAPLFPPTLREVLLRPRWLGVLGVALVVAGVFAWLGQWQLDMAIDEDPLPIEVTEEVKPIADVIEPGQYVPEPLVGHRVDVSGSFVADDFLVVSSRHNDGVSGYWVTGQLRIADTEVPTSIAVAVGWTDSREEADAVAAELNAAPPQDIDMTGRIISDEGIMPPSASQPITEMSRMSPAQLLGFWHDADGLTMYRPYLASESALSSLDVIIANPPTEESSVNWLNIFYAIEWIVFAGFAFFMWYRLAKDAWEKEVEQFEEDHPELATA